MTAKTKKLSPRAEALLRQLVAAPAGLRLWHMTDTVPGFALLDKRGYAERRFNDRNPASDQAYATDAGRAFIVQLDRDQANKENA